MRILKWIARLFTRRKPHAYLPVVQIPDGSYLLLAGNHRRIQAAALVEECRVASLHTMNVTLLEEMISLGINPEQYLRKCR